MINFRDSMYTHREYCPYENHKDIITRKRKILWILEAPPKRENSNLENLILNQIQDLDLIIMLSVGAQLIPQEIILNKLVMVK